MKNQHRLTSRHFAFSIASFIQASALLTFALYPHAKQESWLVLLLAGGVSLLLALIFAQLMKDYHPLSFFEMLSKAFGSVLGKVIQGLYVLFFAIVIATHLRYISEFFLETVLRKTPIHVIIGCLTLLFLWAASYDVTVATRYDSSILFLFFVFTGISLIMLWPHGDFSNLLPIFTLSAEEYGKGGLVVASLFFGDTVCLLYLSKHVTQSDKHTPRFYWIVGFLTGIFSLFLVIFEDLITLGKISRLVTLPMYGTLRTINLAPYFSHVEIIFIYVSILVFFGKLSTLFFVGFDSLKSLVNKPKKKWLSLPVCAGVLAISYILFPTMQSLIYEFLSVLPIVWAPFTILIPVLMLLALKIRGRFEKKVTPAK